MDSTTIHDLSSDDNQQPEKRKSEAVKKETQKKKAKTSYLKKKGRSTVWDDFDKFTDDEGEIKARCKHCSKVLAADPSRNGTSALKRHIISCEKHPEKLKDQTNIFIRKNDDVGGTSGEVKTWKFCAKSSRKTIAEMITLDELPFTTLEHEGFKKFIETICPNFKVPSRFTISRDVGEIFLEEKGNIQLSTSNSYNSFHNYEITPFFFHNQLPLPPEKSQVFSLIFIKISTSKQPSKLRCAETDQICYLYLFITVKKLLSSITKLKVLGNVEQVQQHYMQRLASSFFLDS
ncbi:hypothetical protein E3N88_32962 [Mikania micrantha]|uniref:BED-type domain-containing protein n=1 Tax=Mikania micrantha TaxID=192012 RepID=A0A5N6MAG5_9ASTR|nr:hypothetical protein E3N88_32962 [Mikania micrantha]